MYTYHYHAIRQLADGNLAYLDGIIQRNKPLANYDEYKQLKQDIDADNYDKLTICSLSLLSS